MEWNRIPYSKWNGSADLHRTKKIIWSKGRNGTTELNWEGMDQPNKIGWNESAKKEYNYRMDQLRKTGRNG